MFNKFLEKYKIDNPNPPNQNDITLDLGNKELEELITVYRGKYNS